MREKGVQAGEGRLKMVQSSCKTEESNRLKDPKYEDVTDDEEINPVTELSPHYDCQKNERVLSPKQMCNVKDYENLPELAVIAPEQQEKESSLACTCPYFVETEDGFEQVPCPKCAKDIPSVKQEVQSEDEYEEVILFAMELILKNQIICLDSDEELDKKMELFSSSKEELKVSNPEQHNQDPRFKKVEEYENFEIFIQKYKGLNQNMPNALVDINQGSTGHRQITLSSHKPLTVENFVSESVLSNSSDLKTHCLSPTQGDLGLFDKFHPVLSSPTNAENSSDTDDSINYPSHLNPNYMTASNQVRAQSPLPSNSDSTGNNVMLKGSPENSEDWFPSLSSSDTEEEESAPAALYQQKPPDM
ncbi:hypothetical protein WMY93_030838 [Mugilogobius chulae]|uniref:Uncharacterized protein n=1 Tax=Mugilogobius chulae TaxID=88201 RepID=A0AAW0MQ32_9GOBI